MSRFSLREDGRLAEQPFALGDERAGLSFADDAAAEGRAQQVRPHPAGQSVPGLAEPL
jgi:hypothetical protein